ncbi:MAG: hypothetical protein ACW99G_03475 [Candidatus Thorarchaeota archaeon]|jgi:hypothetical protein
MKIAVALSAHNNTPLVLDAIDAVKRYVTEDILMIYDGASKEWGSTVKVPVCKMEGLVHGYHKAHYRNFALGLWETAKLFPDADWYCCIEPDVLFTSSGFMEELDASDDDVWGLANDYRSNDKYPQQKIEFPLLEKIIGEKIKRVFSILGCCAFYRKEFIDKLIEIDLFNKVLWYSNSFKKGYFPSTNDKYVYDFGEFLYPTLIDHYGKKMKQLAYWDNDLRIWGGNFRKYPMRFKPEIDPIKEDYPESSILHPIKDVNHPIREMKRMQRNANR